MSVTRARDEQAKASRRHQLLAAAATRLDAAGYAATTMSEIAAEAGLAKGTTYLYFRSKEALFLELLLEELAEWVKESAASLSEPTESHGFVDRVALVLSTTVAHRSRLVALLALRYPTLEEGAGPSQQSSFRSRFEETISPLAQSISSGLPELNLGRAVAALCRYLAVVSGSAYLRGSARGWAAAKTPSDASGGQGLEEELRVLIPLLLHGSIARDSL